MINKVTITNHRDQSITLNLRFPEQSGFLIRDILGIGPGKADVNVTDIASSDGAIFGSSRVGSRNVVFTLVFLEFPTIEDTRHLSYTFFPIKERVKMRFETDRRVAEVYGYVESNTPNIFSNQEGSVISVICPAAYLYSDPIITEYSVIENLFEFPFSNESLIANLIEFGNIELFSTNTIEYIGDVSNGIVMYIHALGAVTGIEIQDLITLETMSIDDDFIDTLTGGPIEAGDDIIISTVFGEKYATLIRDGVEYNIRNALGQYPVWFQLRKGTNSYGYSAVSGVSNLQFRIEHRNAYEGV